MIIDDKLTENSRSDFRRSKRQVDAVQCTQMDQQAQYNITPNNRLIGLFFNRWSFECSAVVNFNIS